MSSFNSRTTAGDAISELKDRLIGKNGTSLYVLCARNSGTQSDVVVVTGVSPGGLGTEVVRSIAPHANIIYATGRNKDRYAILSRTSSTF